MIEYTYTKCIFTPQLLDEIATAGLTAPAYINTVGNDITIGYSSELNETDKGTLDTVVSAHVANTSYISPAVQTQINTLIAYLNNAAPSKQAACRAQLILALGPRLPVELITLINSNTKAIVGDP